MAVWTKANDHGLLQGLADDDHTQYHNDGREDARKLGNAGTYDGNDAVDRAIAHGLGVIPRLVELTIADGADAKADRWFVQGGTVYRFWENTGVLTLSEYAVTAPDATSFYVGNATNLLFSGNSSGTKYGWMAIG